jgi:transcriptional regulator NrdR family protein
MVQYSSSIEAFHKNKLFISIYESLKHRPTALADAEALTSTVIGKLLREHKDRESAWPIASIIATTHKVLSNFDTVAATYYGAYFAKTK